MAGSSSLRCFSDVVFVDEKEKKKAGNMTDKESNKIRIVGGRSSSRSKWGSVLSGNIG